MRPGMHALAHQLRADEAGKCEIEVHAGVIIGRLNRGLGRQAHAAFRDDGETHGRRRLTLRFSGQCLGVLAGEHLDMFLRAQQNRGDNRKPHCVTTTEMRNPYPHECRHPSRRMSILPGISGLVHVCVPG